MLLLAISYCWLALLLAFIFFRDLNTKLTISSTSVTGAQGVFHTQRMNSPLNKVTGAKVEQGLLGKIFNYGKISITTAGNVYVFWSIDNPNEFVRILNNQIEVYENDKMEEQAKKIARAMKD